MIRLNSKKMLLSAIPCLLFGLAMSATEREYDYVFFDNSLMADNYYYSKTEYSGKSWIENHAGRVPISESEFSSPGNSLRLSYVSAGDSWNASVIYPPMRGMENFRKPDVLSLRLLVTDRSDIKALPTVAFVSTDKSVSRSLNISDYAIGIRPHEWYSVRIPLDDFAVGRPEDTLVNRFAAVVFSEGRKADKEVTIFIDDIELLPSGYAKENVARPEIVEATGFERHVDIRWKRQGEKGIKYYKIYRSFDGTNFAPVAVRRPWTDRFTDYLGTVGTQVWYKVSVVDYDLKESKCSPEVVSRTRNMSDDELLDMLQLANFRYYWEMAEPVSGLARENVPGKSDMIASGASGFGMMAILTGIHRGFITRAEGVERFLRITSFLEKAERYHGVYPHFMDGTTGETVAWFGPRDNGGDLVETSFMMEGLLCARQFFDGDSDDETTIRSRIDDIWKAIEWSWYRKTPDSPYLYWHWSPDQAWVIDHRLIGWNETMITYLMAIMSPTHSVPAEMYYSGWASQEDYAAEYRSGWGRVHEGDRYTNGNTYYGKRLNVAVSNGGPLFFTHYSFMGFDPHKLTDRFTNYFENNKAIAEVNLRYCMENPSRYVGYGSDCWGLTASDHMWNYSAAEPVTDMDDGTIAPTGALASFPYTQKESMDAFLNYYRNHGSFLWGEYGFRDAFNLTENWVSPIFMGLNQGPVTVMIENYRSGFIWNLFMSHPDVRNGLERLNAIR